MSCAAPCVSGILEFCCVSSSWLSSSGVLKWNFSPVVLMCLLFLLYCAPDSALGLYADDRFFLLSGLISLAGFTASHHVFNVCIQTAPENCISGSEPALFHPLMACMNLIQKFQYSWSTVLQPLREFGHPAVTVFMSLDRTGSVAVMSRMCCNLVALTLTNSCILISMSDIAWPGMEFLERASATGISLPGTYLISTSYGCMRNSILISLGGALDSVFFEMLSRGLWSVCRIICLPYT